jgi:hypothetical protein
MDEIRDQMDLANEISDAISQPVGFGVDMDEDELMLELENLEQEELDTKLLGLENVPISAPSVPNTEPGMIVSRSCTIFEDPSWYPLGKRVVFCLIVQNFKEPRAFADKSYFLFSSDLPTPTTQQRAGC